MADGCRGDVELFLARGKLRLPHKRLQRLVNVACQADDGGPATFHPAELRTHVQTNDLSGERSDIDCWITCSAWRARSGRERGTQPAVTGQTLAVGEL